MLGDKMVSNVDFNRNRCDLQLMDSTGHRSFYTEIRCVLCVKIPLRFQQILNSESIVTKIKWVQCNNYKG